MTELIIEQIKNCGTNQETRAVAKEIVRYLRESHKNQLDILPVVKQRLSESGFRVKNLGKIIRDILIEAKELANNQLIADTLEEGFRLP